jgi:predicted HTH transcriptional regulator
MELKDDDLLLRLHATEDGFVERKTSGDHKDWLPTAVAFANSAPIGYPAVLFIGAKNDGTIEDGPTNFDSLQKTFNRKLIDAYPPIAYFPRIIREGDKECLAIIIPGSELRPHFAGQAYVRMGSETRNASEEQFANLIAQRQSKAYEVLKWKGKQITVDYMRTEHVGLLGTVSHTHVLTVVDCNPYYVTFRHSGSQHESIPLARVNISFDTAEARLKLEVLPF